MIHVNQPLTNEAARKLMALDLTAKELTTYEKLDEWYTTWGGQCYVSFSGGKDSTVLAYLAARYLASFRTPPWELNLVFVNTGLEYPEIQKFVNEYAAWLRREFPRVTVNLVRLRPKMNIRQVVTKYGYSAEPPCKAETFRIEEYQAVIRLGGNAFAPPDAELLDRAKDVSLSDIAFRLKRRGVAHFCIIPWVDGTYALKATLRVAVPEKNKNFFETRGENEK